MRIKSQLKPILDKKFKNDYNNPAYVRAINGIKNLLEEFNHPQHPLPLFDRQQEVIRMEEIILKDLKNNL